MPWTVSALLGQQRMQVVEQAQIALPVERIERADQLGHLRGVGEVAGDGIHAQRGIGGVEKSLQGGQPLGPLGRGGLA